MTTNCCQERLRLDPGIEGQAFRLWEMGYRPEVPATMHPVYSKDGVKWAAFPDVSA